jgi:redox-sensitive bicupin YhaK (pirin superfamily)
VSFIQASEPVSSVSSSGGIAAIVDARPRDIGGFTVRRLLPSRVRRLVGPFIFLDHMGPVALAPGRGIDVWPHPHIGLATVTYLLDGELIHRDSLGSHQPIQPGEINWMTAGRGIVHSERTSPELRRAGSSLHALQLWVALPKAHEETEPAFHHYAARALPEIQKGDGQIRVLIGEAYEVESQVQTLTPTFMIDAVMQPNCELPIPDSYEERAAYVVDGAIQCGAERAEAGRMFVFPAGAKTMVRAESSARLLLLGGAAIDGPRNIWWNFVSSSQERIEQAKRDWKERRFPKVPGDEVEFAPLPTYS